ncbi:MAG: MBL fold metallo-hydrolase, partial [Firmicutes bacterium]|nr:MBL fold metallo-hydrolase [Bacillota bacterium]
SDSDHSGLARWLSELADSPVYVHRYEIRKLTFDYDYYSERLPFFGEAGVPLKALKEILEDYDPVVKPVLPRKRVEAVLGGEELAFEGGSLKIFHLPGHSGGHICLYEAESGSFLAGDLILKHITPNPIMEADPDDLSKRLPTLTQYMESIESLEKLSVRLILPGHGKNIENGAEAVARAKKHHAERLAVVLSHLKNESLTTYQVMRRLYPDIGGFQIYLGVSEVIAHIDYLFALDKITRQNRDGVAYYRVRTE